MEDRFTQLLFRLPAEIRTAIYDICLGPPIKRTMEPHRQLGKEWMLCSSKILAEALPMAYSDRRFRCVETLKIRRTTVSTFCQISEMDGLGMGFQRHLMGTYPASQMHDQIAALAGSVICEIVLELQLEIEWPTDLSIWLHNFFRGWSEVFPRAEKVVILSAPNLVFVRESGRMNWTSMMKYSRSNNAVFLECTAMLDDMFPLDCRCEVEWKAFAQNCFSLDEDGTDGGRCKPPPGSAFWSYQYPNTAESDIVQVRSELSRTIYLRNADGSYPS